MASASRGIMEVPVEDRVRQTLNSIAADNGKHPETPMEMLQLSDKNALVEAESLNTVSGTKKIKYWQQYQNLPVINTLIQLEKDSNGKFTNYGYGFVIIGLDEAVPDVTPKLSEEQALATVREKEQVSVKDVENQEAQLLVYINDAKKAYLAYEVSILFNKGDNPSRPIYIIDAISGNILDKRPGLMTFM